MSSSPFTEASECDTFSNALLFYCTLYTISPDGSNNAVARHVSFAQITCLVKRIRGIMCATNCKSKFSFC